MERLDYIKTGKHECQDCNKCIRGCPVKAIRVRDNCAQVAPELCILCGDCTLTCPSNAKQVCDDLPSAKALINCKRAVIASLAPSFVAQYPAIRPAQLVRALKKLGFFAVSEAALGAQQVSASILSMMREEQNKFWISSQISSRMPAACLLCPLSPPCALQVAARALWQRHSSRLYRSLHRGEEGGRRASRASRCRAHV
jgi:NAD-dependent dihydropyrimidine dehydrogenase PreA subunit